MYNTITVFSVFGTLLNLFIILLVTKLVCNIVNSQLKRFSIKNEFTYSNLLIEYGLCSRHSLSMISDNKFESFCISTLEAEGYFNISKTQYSINNIPLFSGEFKSNSTTEDENSTVPQKTYMYFLQATPITDVDDSSHDNYESLNINALYELIGLLSKDNFHKGIIITNGDIPSNISNMLRNLPSDLEIQLIDGVKLSALSWDATITLNTSKKGA